MKTSYCEIQITSHLTKHHILPVIHHSQCPLPPFLQGMGERGLKNFNVSKKGGLALLEFLVAGRSIFSGGGLSIFWKQFSTADEISHKIEKMQIIVIIIITMYFTSL